MFTFPEWNLLIEDGSLSYYQTAYSTDPAFQAFFERVSNSRKEQYSFKSIQEGMARVENEKVAIHSQGFWICKIGLGS